MEEGIRQLSLRLNDTLDGVGASEEMRPYYRRYITTEIVESLSRRLSQGEYVTYYHFGSLSEGTFTPDMKSDIDVLICNESRPVCIDIKTSPVGLYSYIMVHHEEGLLPGYVKLQLVQDRQPITVPDVHHDTDGQGRICARHVINAPDKDFLRDGPANNFVTEFGLSYDQVHAFRCSTVPAFGNAWLKRCQRNGWPSSKQLERMSKMSCFVVGVGHESSPESHIEWRLSFSLQEREIMFNLNPVQHKCYILMKMLKKDIIVPEVGEESLSSYHCKTVLFHTIESNPRNIWKPENLIYCLMLCIRKLHQAVKSSFCSVFFLADANLFDRECFRRNRPSLLRVIEHILQQDHRIIRYIKCSNFGYSIINKKIPRKMIDNVICMKYHIHIRMTCFWETTFRKFSELNNAREVVNFQFQTLHFLENATVTDHSEEQKSDALSQIKPYIHQRLLVSISVCALESSDELERQMLLRAIDCFFQESQSVDAIGATLAYVTVLYSLGGFELCNTLLEEKEGTLKKYVISKCGCSSQRKSPHKKNEYLIEKLRHENMSQLCFKTTAVVTCIQFLRPECTIVHTALQFEMVRSLFTISESRHNKTDYWFDWAVVDGKIYYYFLKYLVYSRLNKPGLKQQAIEKMRWVIEDDKNLTHAETAYNLLGWIYKEENRASEALKCWKKSWAIRPYHNAAKWHSMLLLFDEYKKNL